jgi:hypothetical protein
MTQEVSTIGWREWVLLPDLGLPEIKAKIDTGARTSCLHAFSVEPFIKDGKQWVRFGIHPHQDDTETEVFSEAEVIDKRMISDSGGHKEERYVIATEVELANQRWPIEITLTNRDTMLFRMLLGRTAMANRIIVDPGKSFLFGKAKKKVTKKKSHG